MKFRAVALLVSLNACAPSSKARLDVELGASRHSQKTIAPVAQPVVRPWKIGQWAIYASDGNGYEAIAVLAEDACGTWFRVELVSADRDIRWQICLREPTDKSLPARPLDWVKGVTVDTEDGPRLARIGAMADDAVFATTVAGLFPARWDRTTSQPESIDVRAGRFEGAVRSDEPDGTRWTHPDVPFSATVRFATKDQHEFELVAYGDDVNASLVKALVRGDRPRIRGFVGLGMTQVVVTGHRDEEDSAAMGPVVDLGYRLDRGLDLTLTSSFLALIKVPAGSATSRRLAIATAGLRWFPFRSPLEHLYLRAGVGYASLDAGSDTVARGAVANLQVGYVLSRSRSWSFDVEAGDHVVWLNSDEGVRHSVGLTIGIQAF